MKKTYVFVAAMMTSFGSFATTVEPIVQIEQTAKEGIALTVNVTSNGKPVKGALVKIVSNKMLIATGMTTENGTLSLQITNYGGQISTIEVFHSLYKKGNISDVKLESGKTYDISLKRKSDSVNEINEEVEELIINTEEAITDAVKEGEDATERKETSIKTQEELKQEQDELAKEKVEIENKLFGFWHSV